jgi:hypothetical protein
MVTDLSNGEKSEKGDGRREMKVASWQAVSQARFPKTNRTMCENRPDDFFTT